MRDVDVDDAFVRLTATCAAVAVGAWLATWALRRAGW
jgi:hypothetical protein